MSDEQQQAPQADSFREKLMHLINTMHPADRGPYSYREIQAGIEAQGGPSVTSAYIHQLANGQRQNPGMNALEALAKFFGVPPEYFFNEETTKNINEQLRNIIAWRDTEARTTAERIMSLDSRDRRMVTNFIDSLDAYDEEPRTRRRRRKQSSDGDY